MPLNLSFVTSVADIENILPADRPEVAFAGRSNVGKSSLLNALANQKQLAKASGNPGCTRLLNYFDFQDKGYLVDLPGYGYARASKVDIARWQELTKVYLLGRPTLQRVFLLIDSRHGIKDNDLPVMEELNEAAVPWQIVLTKVDKIGKEELARVHAKTAAVCAKQAAALNEVLVSSATKNVGLQEISKELQAIWRG